MARVNERGIAAWLHAVSPSRLRSSKVPAASLALLDAGANSKSSCRTAPPRCRGAGQRQWPFAITVVSRGTD
jgi:hypothetical protein